MRNLLRGSGWLMGLMLSLAWLRADGDSDGDANAVDFEAHGPQARERRGRGSDPHVYKARVEPHWLTNMPAFWYRNDLAGGQKEFILVDAEKGLRAPAFNHEKLAAALAKATGGAYEARKLPFADISLDTAGAVTFTISNVVWRCDLNTWTCAGTQVSTNNTTGGTNENANGNSEPEDGDGREGARGVVRSPDGKSTVFTKDHNVFLRGADGAAPRRLTEDGVDGNEYRWMQWSPDGAVLVAWRVAEGERKEVFLIESSPRGGGRAILKRRPYALPGDRFPRYELNLIDVASGKCVKPEVPVYEHEWERPEPHWETDHRHFAYQVEDRGHQRFRLIEVDSVGGAARTVLDETAETFIWTTHTEMLRLGLVNWLERTDEVIYVSERDGWRHLYLVNLREGNGGIVGRLTKGEWVLRGIDHIDEQKRQVWFHAGGMNKEQDPYFLHHYRVNFDGTGLVALTEGDGTHSARFSPDRRYVVDTWSRVDAAPRTVLRSATDGRRICDLEEADIAELKESGWIPPEVFVAKGRDGRTDIWGVLARPAGFDPHKKYPVLENIYNGPQGAYVPKAFSGRRYSSSLTDAGYVVVQMDGMGTGFRSKAFHDVCFKNLKDGGLPDRIAWHRAAAAKYPWYDLGRVGIFGTSAGGQNAAAAVLFHSDFYKAAVANCGCHDNRMDKASWNEQWMGYPVGPQYAANSNIDNAWQLGSKLLLIVGEEDMNVPPESTMRFVDALIKANKDFELLVVPGEDHGVRGPASEYVDRRMREFFARYVKDLR